MTVTTFGANSAQGSPADVGMSNSLASFVNFNSLNTLRLRAGLGRAASGKGNAILACLGDSNTAGHGAGTGGDGYVHGVTNSYPFTLSNIANNGTRKAESIFGNLNVGQYISDPADARVTLGANWGFSSNGDAGIAVGGYMWKYTNGGTVNNLSFVPGITFDTIEVMYPTFGGGGTFSINVDGGAAVITQSQAGTNTLQRFSATVTRGTHTINVVPSASTAPLYIMALRAYDSTNPSVEVWNWGHDGATVSTYTGATASPWNAFNAIKQLAPDCVIVNLMLNDCNAGISGLAAYQTAMQSLITQLLINSDVILSLPFTPGLGFGSSTITQGTLNAFVQACYALAQSNNIPLIDHQKRYGSWATINPYGYTFNELHMSQLGYGDYAEGVLRALQSMA